MTLKIKENFLYTKDFYGLRIVKEITTFIELILFYE